MVVFTALTTHISGPEGLEMVRETKIGQMMPADQWQQQYEDSLAPSPVKRLIDGVSAGAGIWIYNFILAAVLALFAKLAGGAGTFKQTLGVVFWAMLIPSVLVLVLRLPLIFLQQTVMGTNLGLAALAMDAERTSLIYQVLVSFGDFLTWWALAVIVIGFRQAHAFSRVTAITVAVMPWLLLTAAGVGIGRLFM